MVAASVAAIAADQNPSPSSGLRRHVCRRRRGVPQYLNPVIAATDVDEDVTRLAFSVSRATTRRGRSSRISHRVHTESDGRIWTFDIREDARGTTANRSPPMTSCTRQASAGSRIRGPVQRCVPRRDRRPHRASHGALHAAGCLRTIADSTTVPLIPSHLLGNGPYAGLPDSPSTRARSVRALSRERGRRSAGSCSCGTTTSIARDPAAEGRIWQGDPSLLSRSVEALLALSRARSTGRWSLEPNAERARSLKGPSCTAFLPTTSCPCS